MRKRRNVIRLFAFLLIQVFFVSNFAWVQGAAMAVNQQSGCLSPAIKINNQEIKDSFKKTLSGISTEAVYPQFLTSSTKGKNPTEKSKIELVSFESIEKNGQYQTIIELYFKHERPGFLSNVLEQLSPAKALPKHSAGNMLWFECFEKDGRRVFKFEMATSSRKDAMVIKERLRGIEDKKNLVYEEAREEGVKKYILEFDIRDTKGRLLQIAKFLKNKNINITNFLTPRVFEGRAYFTFEIEVPIRVNSITFEAEVKTEIKPKKGKIKLSEGQLVDRVLDNYLFEEIKEAMPAVSRDQRERIKAALTVVTIRHLSRTRKDRRTPFLMHQVEVAKILANKIKIFSPEIIAYISKELNLVDDKVIRIILNSALLHDAVEDGDISELKLRTGFNEFVYRIVLLLSRKPKPLRRQSEVPYLNNLIEKEAIIGLLGQIIKIADRIHNIRTLQNNAREFQREIFYSTLDTFYPYFIDKIDLEKIENEYLKKAFERARDILEKEVRKTGQELGLLDKENKIVEEEFGLYLKEQFYENGAFRQLIREEIANLVEKNKDFENKVQTALPKIGPRIYGNAIEDKVIKNIANVCGININARPKMFQEKEYKALKKITYEIYEEFKNEKSVSLDILSDKILERKKSEDKSVQSYLKLPPEEKIEKIVKFIKRKLPDWEIKSIYLFGSSLWKEKPSDFDVIIFIDDKNKEGFIDGRLLKGTPETPDVHYIMINLDFIKKKAFSDPWDFIITNYISGRCIYGENVIKDVMSKFELTLIDLLEFSKLSLENSFEHSDHLFFTFRQDEKVKKQIFKDENEMHEFVKSKMKKAIKAFFNSYLIVKEVINKIDPQSELSPMEEIFALRQRADNYQIGFDLEGKWANLEKVIDYWNTELDFLDKEREKLKILVNNLKEICVLRQESDSKLTIDSLPKRKIPDNIQIYQLIKYSI